VLELGMSYTLERDDVLRASFYGSEGLVDLNVASGLFSAETNRLFQTPTARPMVLEEEVRPRFTSFTNRLNQRLLELQQAGQPEIPRLVGHTLRLLDLLQIAHRGQPTNSPPPALEMWREGQTNRLVLYGEPYAHYNLQYSDNLTAPAWSPVIMPGLQFQTNVHSEQVIVPPASGSAQRFYRGMLPPPQM